MDEIAKLYINRNGKRYRLKVFPLSVWLERQPAGIGASQHTFACSIRTREDQCGYRLR